MNKTLTMNNNGSGSVDFEKKAKLKEKILGISADKLMGIVKILADDKLVEAEINEFEFDLDKIPRETFLKLEEYMDS